MKKGLLVVNYRSEGQMTSLLIDHVGSSGTDDKSSHRSGREQWDR